MVKALQYSPICATPWKMELIMNIHRNLENEASNPDTVKSIRHNTKKGFRPNLGEKQRVNYNKQPAYISQNIGDLKHVTCSRKENFKWTLLIYFLLLYILSNIMV